MIAIWEMTSLCPWGRPTFEAGEREAFMSHASRLFQMAPSRSLLLMMDDPESMLSPRIAASHELSCLTRLDLSKAELGLSPRRIAPYAESPQLKKVRSPKLDENFFGTRARSSWRGPPTWVS